MHPNPLLILDRKMVMIAFLPLIIFAIVQAGVVKAQDQIEAKQFRQLQDQSKSNDQVIYFFWYGAPFVYDLLPELTAWQAKNSSLKFQAVPTAFRSDFEIHSQIFYALEELNRQDLHARVMLAMHTQRRRLMTDDDISAWAQEQGLNKSEFIARIKSQSVLDKVGRANNLANFYIINGVPNFVVYGKFVTGPSIAGSKQKALETIDYLAKTYAPGPSVPFISNKSATGANSMPANDLTEAKSKCLSLGFNIGTESFGKCVLRLSK